MSDAAVSTSPHTPPLDVIIVGGGIAGLTAAYDLTRAGRRVHLLEARPRLGGLVCTERLDAPDTNDPIERHYLIETGADALLMQKPAAGELCDELGLRLVPTRTPRTAFVLRDGVLHPIASDSMLGIPVTDEAIAASGMLSAEGKVRLASDLVEPRENPRPDEDQSVGAFIRRRFGDEVARYLAQPLLGGIHAGDIDQLSLRALFPALAEADAQPGSLLRTFRARRRPPMAGGVFRSVEGGLSRLIDALVQRLPADTIRTDAEVARLVPPPTLRSSDADASASESESASLSTSWTIELTSGAQLTASAVLLAAPAYVVADLVAPFDSPIADTARAIPYVSSASVTLCYQRASVSHSLAGTGFVTPEGEDMPLMAVSWVTSKWDGRAPSDHIMLRAFAGGLFDAARVDASDAELVRMSHDSLSALLGLSARPIFSKVYRWRRAGPQYLVGHLDRMRGLDERLAHWPGLFITGCGFRGIGIPDNVSNSRRAAATIDGWLPKVSAN